MIIENNLVEDKNKRSHGEIHHASNSSPPACAKLSNISKQKEIVADPGADSIEHNLNFGCTENRTPKERIEVAKDE